jgi:hypothetical protein
MVDFQLEGSRGQTCPRPGDGVFGAVVITPKMRGCESPETIMKVTIEMDMTPQEARAFMGLPDVAAQQQKMMDDMKAAFEAGDPDAMERAWAPVTGGADAFQKFQKLMWDSAAAMAAPGKSNKKDGK